MRKLLLALSFFIVTLVLLAHFSPISAQTSNNYLYLNGNVGVGTNNPGTNNGSVGRLLNIETSGGSGALNAVLVGSQASSASPGSPLILEGRVDNVTSGDSRVGQIQLLNDNGATTGLSGDISFLTNNAGSLTEKMRITNTGNVGVGTTNPTTSQQNKLTIHNGADENFNFNGPIAAGTGVTLNAANDAYNANIPLELRANPLILGMVGNVGIGTTNPAFKLETDGDIYANGGWLRVSGSNGLYWQSYGTGWYSQDGTWLRTYNNASIWANGGTIGTNGCLSIGYGGTGCSGGSAIIAGNVGIGTTAPGNLLDVNGSATFGGVGGNQGSEPINTMGGGSGISMADRNGGSNPRWVIYPAASVLRFWSNGDLMGIQTNGNVGIGTTSPGAKLEVNGTSAFDGATDVWNNGWLTVHNGTITAQGKNALVLNGGSDTYGGTYIGFYDTVGDLPGYPNNNYHIIKTDDWALNFAVGGVYAGYIDSGGFHSISAKSRKENYQTIDLNEVLSKIDQLPVAKWNYITGDSTIKHIGPFAEDFHSAFGLSGIDTQTIDYTDEIGVSLAGVKALSQEVKDLQKQNQDLEKRLDSLEKKVDGL